MRGHLLGALDRTGLLDVEGDRLACQRLHKDLRALTMGAKHALRARFFMDAVVGQRGSFLELLG